jgi:hypothetical protein
MTDKSTQFFGAPASESNPQSDQGAGRPPARPPLDTYYSNVVLVATSPREVSILFGRLLTPPPGMTDAPPRPSFSKQIFMTVEQAEELAQMLGDAAEAFRERMKKYAS